MSILIKPTEPINDTHLCFSRVSSGEQSQPAFNAHSLIVPSCLVVFCALLVMGFRGAL